MKGMVMVCFKSGFLTVKIKKESKLLMWQTVKHLSNVIYM